MFCGTTVTVISGAVAERLRFSSYLLVAAAVALLVYPVFGHWAWSGVDVESPTGWLGMREVGLSISPVRPSFTALAGGAPSLFC